MTFLRKIPFHAMWLSAAAAIILLTAPAALAQEEAPSEPAAETTNWQPDFDHNTTGFPLYDLHGRVSCESCHTRGIFAGTPRQCQGCHTEGAPVAATPMPPDHIRSTQQCEDCHTTTTPWSFVPRIDHASVLGYCFSCHNDVIAEGKNLGHINSSNQCEDCHQTTAWQPARFDHNMITAACFTCHNGVIATPKNPTHFQTSNLCEDCHSTLAWVPATFDHNNVAGSCNSCHDGVTATGKPIGHFVTPAECDDCHVNTQWLPSTFTHTSPNYPGDHNSGVDCVDCHQNNSQTVMYQFAAYQPDCAACHASDFKQGPHKKTEGPDTFYTVGELRDCSGACHIYTDATLTVIKKMRSGEHRARDGDF